MDGAVALLLMLLATGGSLALSRSRRRPPQTVRLRFGRDLAPEAVGALLDAVAGLHHRAAVTVEVRADEAGIEHYLSGDQATLDTLRAATRAVLPGLRLEPVTQLLDDDYRYGRSLRLRGRLKVLRSDMTSEVSAGLLAAVQPLGKHERLLLRWVLRAGRPQPVPLPQDPQGRPLPSEHRRLLKLKNDGSIVRARALLAVTAHPERARHLLSRVTTVLRGRSTAYGYLRSAPRSGRALGRLLGARSFVLSDRYAAAELAGLLGWPIGSPALPGLQLGVSPLLMPARRIPTSGRLLGTATWPGVERPVAQPLMGALSHCLIAGPTGVGKSTLLTNLLASDVAEGRGVVLIDGKGDTAAALLARIPEARHEDVIVLDCASRGPLPGLRLFGGEHPELAADIVLGVLSDLFKSSWGPLSERYLRAGLVAVAHDPHGTLADVPFVFSDPAYRRRLVGRLRDPLVRATFAGFEAMSAGERQQQLAAPLNKLGTLLGRPVVRTVLGQTAPTLDFAEVLRSGGIVVVSLAPARVGAPAARLIGALTVFALFQAVQGRSDVGERSRAAFMVAIDEPRALGDLPMPLDALLEQARGLGVGVTLSPQSISQLPKSVREAALTNVATRVVFRQHADDARLLARDLPGVSAEELGELAAYEAVARIGLGPGDVAPPVSLRTRPPSKTLSNPAALRALSAARFGVSLEAVDAALDARHRAAAHATPVGRTRRPA